MGTRRRRRRLRFGRRGGWQIDNRGSVSLEKCREGRGHNSVLWNRPGSPLSTSHGLAGSHLTGCLASWTWQHFEHRPHVFHHNSFVQLQLPDMMTFDERRLKLRQD